MTEKDLIIQDLRRENAELRARVPQWISVDDRLPELDTDQVLVLDENGNIYNTWYDGCIDDRCRFGHYRAVYNSDTLGFDGVDWVPDEGVTHWMPMPEPPKGE